VRIGIDQKTEILNFFLDADEREKTRIYFSENLFAVFRHVFPGPRDLGKRPCFLGLQSVPMEKMWKNRPNMRLFEENLSKNGQKQAFSVDKPLAYCGKICLYIV